MRAEFVQATSYTKGRRNNKVRGVVQHYTAAGDGRSLARWFASGKAKVSAHFIVCRDGHIIQCVDTRDTAWHAGTRPGRGDQWMGAEPPKNVNLFTVGIENSNYGWLVRHRGRFYLPNKKAGKWVPGRRYDGPEPVYATDDQGVPRWWEPYTQEIIGANIRIIRQLRKWHPTLDDGTAGAIMQPHSGVSPGRKLDPGPLFPMAVVRARSWSADITAPAFEMRPPHEIDEIRRDL